MVGGSYGYFDLKIIDFGMRIMFIGCLFVCILLDNGGLYVKYEFSSGLLKGFFVNFGMIYLGEMLVLGLDVGDIYLVVGVFLCLMNEWM